MNKLLGLLLALVLLAGCTTGGDTADGAGAGYTQITQAEAAEIMASETGYVILDVRSQAEYDGGHIPGAICIPHDTIRGDVPELPDKSQRILVYCRSGNRSKAASEALSQAGYTNVLEFGGINTWTGEIEK